MKNKIPYPEIQFVADDVEVITLRERLCVDCGDCEATHTVLANFRSAGFSSSVGRDMCLKCAKKVAARIKEGLLSKPIDLE
jgi:hypothetical protein